MSNSNFEHLLKCTIIIHPHSGWFFFFGHSPNTTSHAQVRLLLACQPRVGLLATRERVSRVKQCQLVTLLILLQLVGYITFYCCSVLSDSIHIVSLTPKLAVSVCKLHVPILLKYHHTTFSL